MRKLTLLLLAATLLASPSAGAATINFILDGTAGQGLLPGNENPAVAGGTGGLGSGGIVFDDVTKVLSIDVLWGSGNGFTDLTGNATAMHIHGPTANPAPTSFGENAGAIINLHTLPGFTASASSGGLADSVTLNATQESWLLAGRLYINVHTSVNPNGEIRGTMVVPEPGTLALAAGALLGLAAFGRLGRRAR